MCGVRLVGLELLERTAMIAIPIVLTVLFVLALFTFGGGGDWLEDCLVAVVGIAMFLAVVGIVFGILVMFIEFA